METNENRARTRGWIWILALAAVVGVVAIASVFDGGDDHAPAVTAAATAAAPPPAPTPANSAPPATKAATPAPTPESTVTVSPPSWSPPEWLLGYWSTADGVWQVAAEPGWVDVVIYGDEALVSYTIEDWSDDRGDVFSLTVTSAGDTESIEWETNRRRYRDGGMTWVAQALEENGAPVVEMELRYVNADTVTLLLTVGEDQSGMRLTRDG